jgi:hypothetical protein
VCICVQQNILNAEYKEDKILVTKWKFCEEKNHSGAAKPKKFTIQKQSNLQSTRTHKTYCSSHTFNYNTKLIVNVSQSSFLLERSLMESFTLGPTPKIDFTRTKSTHRQQLESYQIFNSP